MKTILRLCSLVVALTSIIPLTGRTQNWADSLSRDERFWGKSGGYARQIALAGGGFGMLADTNGTKTSALNPYSVDPLFMLTNPAYAAQYRSYLWFDVGLDNSNAGQEFGGTFSLADNFTAGLILGRSDGAGFTLVNPNMFNQITSIANTLSIITPANTWELFGALHAGSLDVGLGLSYVTSSANTTSQSVLDTTSRFANFHQLGLNAGILFHGDDGLLLDAGVTALMPSASSGTSATGDLNVTALGINARMFIPLKKEFYLVPIVNAYLTSGTSTFLATPKDLPSGTNIDAGVGVNFWQGGIHVMSGVSFSTYKQTVPAIANFTPSLTKSETIFPRWNIGAEWPALKWLTLRLGYFASSGSETRETMLTSTTTASTTIGRDNLYSPFFSGNGTSSGVSLGAGFQVGRLAIDATVSDAALHSPFSIFQTGPLGFVTLSYRFD